MNLIIKLKGQVDKMLPGHLKKLASEAKELRAKKEQLDRAMRAGKAQQSLRKEMQETSKIYNRTRREMKLLEDAKKSGRTLTEQEKRNYQALNQKAKELERTFKSQTKSYQKYGMELKKLKIPFDQLQSEIDQTKRKYKELAAEQRIAGGVAKFKQGFGRFKEKAVATAKRAVAIGAVATIGIGISSVQDYLQFDKQMMKVKALTGATSDEFQLLKEKAMEVGKTTIFTSDEAAAGMEKFALAGYKPKEIIAALPPMFDLAAASGEDFIMISDLISDYMRAFNLDSKQIGSAADIMANAMSRSNVTIEALGESFKYTASSADAFKVDLATMTSALGVMADQGSKGGQAGTSLNSALSKLSDSKIQKKLKTLGINIKNSKGEFIGLSEVIRQVDKKTKTMDDLDKQALLFKLFGERGKRAMNLLLTATKEVNGVVYQGADLLEKFANESDNAYGKAKKMSKIQLDSDSGKWDLLKSAISDVKLRLGEMVFKEGGIDIIGLTTQYANELSNVLSGTFNDTQANQFWQEFIKNAKMAFNAAKEIGVILWNVFKVLNTIGIDNILVFVTVFSMTSKAIKFGKAVSDVFTIIKNAGGIFSALNMGITALGGPISLFIAAIVLIGYIIYKNWDTIKGWLTAIRDGINNFVTWLKEKVAQGTRWLVENIIKAFLWIIEKAKWFAWNVGIYLLGPIGFVIRHWDFLKEKATNVFQYFKGIMLSIGEKIKNFFTNVFDAIPRLISAAKDKTIDFLKSIPGVNLIFKETREKKKAIDGSHAGGLSYVPFDGYLAELHKGERVLTKEENSGFLGNLRNRLSSTASSNNSDKRLAKTNAPIIIQWNPSFNGVSEETKNSILEEMKKQILFLEEKIKEIMEGEETSARTAL